MASIEKRTAKSGDRWRVVWWQDGRRQQKTLPTEEQATRFRKLVEGSENRWPPGWEPKPSGPARKLTFGEWGKQAVAQRTAANERTKHDYLRDLETHFAAFADLPVDEIDRARVARWLEERGKVVATKTLRNLHGFASSIMEDARKHRPPLADHNPFDGGLGRFATVRTEEMVFFTPQEFDLILSHIPDERNYRELFRLLFAKGLRFGEATALEVGDIDLLGKRRTLRVTKAWKRLDGKTWVVGEPKTPNARRTHTLGGELTEMLIPLVAGRRSSELLFCGPHGLRLPHTEVYKRAWAPAVARANVCDRHYGEQRNGRGKPPRLPVPCDCAGVLGKTPRIHDVRHSWVSWMLAEGVALEVISKLAGHSNIHVTYGTYGHLDSRHDEIVDAATDRVLARR